MLSHLCAPETSGTCAVCVVAKKPTRAQRKVRSVMHDFKGGGLHSGKGGKVVTSRKQAIAIALSEASRLNKKKKPKRK